MGVLALVVIVLLIAIFGLGSVVEAAFWLMLVTALAVLVGGFLAARAIRSRI